MKNESGTYAEQTGVSIWPGLVQNNNVELNTNVFETRYVGGGDRNVQVFTDGPTDVNGTLTYFPQDMRLFAFALGSIVDSGSPSPYDHDASELNNDAATTGFVSGTLRPFTSFTLIDSEGGVPTGSAFTRRIRGCVIDSFTLTAEQGELLTADVNYIAQHVSTSGNAAQAVTESTLRPLHWQDVRLHIPSGAALVNAVQTATAISFTINNNIEAEHYLNGSKEVAAPFPLNRDYELVLTMNGDFKNNKTLYKQHYQSGTEFNALLRIQAADAGLGSRDFFLTISGCRVMSYDAPTDVEGVAEHTVTIHSKGPVVMRSQDLIQRYGVY